MINNTELTPPENAAFPHVGQWIETDTVTCFHVTSTFLHSHHAKAYAVIP